MLEPSLFITGLADALAGDQLGERLLLAPSHRVGRQWLDRAAERLGGVANVRAVTVRRLFLDLADPELRRRGLRSGGSQERLRHVGAVLDGLRGTSPDGYFTRLPSTLGLAVMLLASMEEAEAAGVSADGIAGGIADAVKARELAALWRGYDAARREAGLAGAGEIHRAALRRLAGAEFAPPVLVAPDDLVEELSVAERDLLSRWPRDRFISVPTDAGDMRAAADFFAAGTTLDEAREILRRIQARNIPLDRVEVVAVDPASAIPALCAALGEAFGGRPEAWPATFSGGVPAALSRPGRLLAAWTEWVTEGFPAEDLARMLDAELLGEGWLEAAPSATAADLAARLRELPISGDPGDYRRLLGGDGVPSRLAGAERWLAAVLADIMPDGGDARATLAAAETLLRLASRRDDRLDAYVRKGLRDGIGQWHPLADWSGFDAMAWLREQAADFRVMGLGPRPGRLHVGDLFSGGHSGREHTFVMGIDDSRFPGSSRQDPVLLDAERRALSRRLTLSGQYRRRRERAFSGLLARLRGTATLSHARRDASGRELFPSPALVRLRQAAVAANADTGLVPDASGKSLSAREDWLSVLVGKGDRRPDARVLAERFPGLAGGERAASARASGRFGEYDGHVPEAGRDFTAGDDAPAVSPTDFEVLARCPRDFFYRRVLGVRPPDRYEPKPGRWLEPRIRGDLLHRLFQDFLVAVAELGDNAPPPDERGAMLDAMLAESLRRHRRRFPPRDPLARRREEQELAAACAIFLAGEETRGLSGSPLYFEVALGGAREQRTPWDRAAPLRFSFAPEAPVMLAGRVDRIDRLHGGGLVILDYKTGRSHAYSPGDPFRKGRHLQPYLYARMLERALEEKGLPEPVRGFAYFFPMPRDEGRTVYYDRAEMEPEGGDIMRALSALLAAGCFPFTEKKDDVKHSDYLPIHGDVDQVAAQAARKATDPLLAEWAALRGL